MSGLSDYLKKRLENSTLLIIVFSAIIIISVIAGGILGVPDALKEIFSDYTVNLYCRMLSPESSAIKFSALRTFNAIIIFIPAFLLSFTSVTLYFNSIIVFYRSYALGVTFKIFISTVGVSGFPIFLFTVFLQSLFVTAAIVLFTVLSLYDRNNKTCKTQENILKNLILSLILAIIGTIAEFILITCIFRSVIF